MRRLAMLVCAVGVYPGASSAEQLVSKEGNFSIAMPCTAAEQVKETPSGVTYHQFKCRAPNFAASIAYARHPGPITDSKATLDEAVSGGIETLQANGLDPKVVENKEAVSGAHPGRAYRVRISRGVLMAQRVFVDKGKGRVYTIMAGASEATFPEKDVAAFLDSFAITAK